MQNIKEYVAERKQQIKNEIEYRKLNGITIPHLAIIQVGNVSASNTYVKNKIADCEACGVTCELYHYAEDISETHLLKIIEDLNNDNVITGFIVQFPLPKHISEAKVMKAIATEKDLDGFNKYSKTTPATPLGIYKYLKDMNYDFVGKNAVVIGRSEIVGKPMAELLINESMNVTVLHSKTPEHAKKLYLANADLVVVATGHIGTLTKDYYLKKSAIVFDVGINFGQDGKLIGDCERDLCVEFQSPVPGGCGLLTRLALLENAFELIS
jgi:methylenetetrahydrofolate dehydrogenase (NADP+)/methenyltetrahydrofolate cyclohydrolase